MMTMKSVNDDAGKKYEDKPVFNFFFSVSDFFGATFCFIRE